MKKRPFIQLLLASLTRATYGIQTWGCTEIEGGALLVCNHVSRVDSFALMATIKRPIHFLMTEEYYNQWWIRPFAKALGVISVPADARGSVTALKRAGELIEQGELVCIFPEEQIARTGTMLPFRRGAELIVKNHCRPIIPIHIDSKWDGRQVTINIGESLPPTTPMVDVRRIVERLQADTWIRRQASGEAVQNAFLRQARRAPWKTCLVDKDKSLTRHKLLTGGYVIADAFEEAWKGQQNVGIMLPPTIASVATNLAAALADKTSVNLNFTTGPEQLASAIEQSELKTLITSRAFLEKVPVTLPEGLKVFYLEDLQIKPLTKLSCALKALWPRMSKTSPDKLATLIFTSGSTGAPKGVMLSHFNVNSNVEGVSRIVPTLEPYPHMLHTLPLFHSFGYMMMWLGLNHNISLVLHPSPFDGATIGTLIAKHKVSIIMTTPTFLRVYLRRITPAQMASVQCPLTGAEKLPKSVADAFTEKFGTRPIEGYGVTECAPVVAASTLNIREPGTFQVGTKYGAVGHVLPGVCCKVVCPDTYEELPAETEGLLLVRGPNVMKGYLNRPDLTAEVMRDGWYITGDIATLDADGFLTITDRISRFSKIGAEMVPHGKVEEALNELSGEDERVFAVTAVEDETRGERLIVLHSCSCKRAEEIYRKLELPPLFTPRLSDFIQVESIPMLGSGKLDIKGVKDLAVKKVTEITKTQTQRDKHAVGELVASYP